MVSPEKRLTLLKQLSNKPLTRLTVATIVGILVKVVEPVISTVGPGELDKTFPVFLTSSYPILVRPASVVGSVNGLTVGILGIMTLLVHLLEPDMLFFLLPGDVYMEITHTATAGTLGAALLIEPVTFLKPIITKGNVWLRVISSEITGLGGIRSIVPPILDFVVSVTIADTATMRLDSHFRIVTG